MSRHGHILKAVGPALSGASDFLKKPLLPEQLLADTSSLLVRAFHHSRSDSSETLLSRERGREALRRWYTGEGCLRK